MTNKYLITGTLVTFLVAFNLGYVFHDLTMGNWFHEKIGHITREEYIIPVIGLAYLLYCLIQTFLFPIFYEFASNHWKWERMKTGLLFGLLIGFTWDALEGGIIEYATMPIPFESFLVDSSYHTIEGGLIGVMLGLIHKRTVKNEDIPARTEIL